MFEGLTPHRPKLAFLFRQNAVYRQALTTLLAALADEEIFYESTREAIEKAKEVIK